MTLGKNVLEASVVTQNVTTVTNAMVKNAMGLTCQTWTKGSLECPEFCISPDKNCNKKLIQRVTQHHIKSTKIPKGFHFLRALLLKNSLE